ncbi:MAG: RING finger and WD repeat domain-containing protein 3 [Marteilia pararefringens]
MDDLDEEFSDYRDAYYLTIHVYNSDVSLMSENDVRHESPDIYFVNSSDEASEEGEAGHNYDHEGVDQRIYDDEFIQISQTCQKVPKASDSAETKPGSQAADCICCAHEKSSVCSICLERFSVVGDHRLCSLRCGHLFGYECIYNWIKSSCASAKCPLCNEPCSARHIRLIYATLVLGEDNTLSNSLKNQLKKVTEERNYFESQHVQDKFRLKLKDREISELKDANKDLRDKITFSKSRQGENIGNHSKQFNLLKSQIVSDNGGCRFIRKSESLMTLITVIPSISALAPGFGLRILSMLELKPIQYIPIHTKPIKSLTAMSDLLLLTTSLDRTFKLTDLRTAQPSSTHEFVDIPWSSAVNSDNTNIFYCGTNKGIIHTFDIRKPSIEVSRTTSTLNDKPIPIFGMEFSAQDQQRPPGIFTHQCSMLKFNFCSDDIVTENSKLFTTDSSISAINFHSQSQHLLVSKRPNKFDPCITHELQQVEIIDKKEAKDESDLQVGVHIIHKFKGGSMSTYLNQSYIIPNPVNNELCVISGDEESRTVYIWNITNGKIENKIYSRENGGNSGTSDYGLNHSTFINSSIIANDSKSTYSIPLSCCDLHSLEPCVYKNLKKSSVKSKVTSIYDQGCSEPLIKKLRKVVKLPILTGSLLTLLFSLVMAVITRLYCTHLDNLKEIEDFPRERYSAYIFSAYNSIDSSRNSEIKEEGDGGTDYGSERNLGKSKSKKINGFKSKKLGPSKMPKGGNKMIKKVPQLKKVNKLQKLTKLIN